MNGGKDVKLSTLKSNGIFLFNYAWLNLCFKMWMCLCIIFVCMSACVCLLVCVRFACWACFSKSGICVWVCTYSCLCVTTVTHMGVIQNRNYVLSSGCFSVIFPLINCTLQRALASAFSISPWSREESLHLSVFIHFLAYLPEDTVLI